MDDIVDAGGIDIDIARQPILTDAVRLHELLGENLTGRDGIEAFCLGHS